MAANLQELKNKAQTKAVATKSDNTIEGLLIKMQGEIQRALPKHMTADRLARITLTTLRLNPKLMECNQASLLGAVMQAAQLGLEPGMLGQCYLIPYKNNKLNTTECQFQIGYKGLIELLRRTGQVSVIECHEVCENDEFEFSYGVDGTLRHKPCVKGHRGDVYCYYAYAKLKDGSHAFLVMSIEDIHKIRDKYSKSKDYRTGQLSGPWATEPDAMCKKTVLKQLIKYLPLSVEIMNQVNADETTKTEIKQDMATESLDIELNTGDFLEVDYTVEPVETESTKE